MSDFYTYQQKTAVLSTKLFTIRPTLFKQKLNPKREADFRKYQLLHQDYYYYY